ncbi:MAG: O-antigen ligase family protein [Vulcanimicrobiaceae bacterium]
MSVSARRPGGTLLGRGLLILGSVALAALLAAYVSGGGNLRPAEVAALAFAPLGLYLVVRSPLLFPFGLYLLLVPFDPLLTFSNGPGPTLTRFLGIASSAALAASTLIRRRAYAPPRSWYAWGAAIAFMVLTALWSIDIDTSFVALQVMLQLFLLFTILATYTVRPGELNTLFRIVVVGGVLASLYGAYVGNSHPSEMMSQGRLFLTSGNLELDPNHFGASLLFASAILVAWFFFERRTSLRILYMLLFSTILTTLLLTGSRGALVALGVIFTYVAIRSRNLLLLGVTAGATLGASLAVPNVWSRFSEAERTGGSGRTDIWQTGIQALHSTWLAGAGFGNFGNAYSRSLLDSVQHRFYGWDRAAHNLILQSWVETGIFGLALILFAWWASFRQNADVKPGQPLYPERIAVEAATLALFWDSFTIDLLWYKYLWVVLTFAVLVANVYRPRLLFTQRVRVRQFVMPERAQPQPGRTVS